MANFISNLIGELMTPKPPGTESNSGNVPQMSTANKVSDFVNMTLGPNSVNGFTPTPINTGGNTPNMAPVMNVPPTMSIPQFQPVNLGAMSDRRSKTQIQYAHDELDGFLNNVYQTVISKRK